MVNKSRESKVLIFLGGSSGDWRKDLIAHLVDTFGGEGIRILNPKRNCLAYGLEALKQTDIEIYHFFSDPARSINLLELVVFLNHRSKPEDICVYCSKDYERRGYVNYTCKKDGIQIPESEEDWMLGIKMCVGAKLKEKGVWL